MMRVVDVSKRNMLKLAAGAGAMAATARADNALPGPPALPYPDHMFTGRGETPLDTFGPDPIKQAAISIARAQLDRDSAALSRKRRSLERLKSVSPAWIEAQCEQIDRQQNALYRAFQEIVGDADDMIPF